MAKPKLTKVQHSDYHKAMVKEIEDTEAKVMPKSKLTKGQEKRLEKEIGKLRILIKGKYYPIKDIWCYLSFKQHLASELAKTRKEVVEEAMLKFKTYRSYTAYDIEIILNSLTRGK